MDKVLEITEVSLIRQGKNILNNVSWQIKKGEHWIIIGANGSGKTTLMRIVAGTLWPSKGEVSVLGEKFGKTDLRELRKTIAWVSSALHTRIPTNFKVIDIVLSGVDASIGIYRKPSSEDRKKACKFLSEMESQSLKNRNFGTLSMGEQQRVIIARALMTEPQLLVFDEPCAGLDIVARDKMLSSIENLLNRNEPPTLVYVTHHVEEIAPFSTHVLMLKKGEMIGTGRKKEVLTDEMLSNAFDTQINIEFYKGRYRASLP